eukprot:Gregarina_sp_Poly_1__3084@NODE_186_length_11711_cov_65_603057_g165_i0_p4_GENE_NODE_186_length_11711_cov_65_603057_g165_i0NODE_186_length_11711_cov_65_603057_g165_i0_p4_ORF_typecomplete_len521_score66_70GLE1/PF07817_13/1e15ZapB/PF06005_12/4_9ZapB/PF06005_12/1_1e04_NODE_186_length_11711_cov_65_603057_g165_i037945356
MRRLSPRPSGPKTPMTLVLHPSTSLSQVTPSLSQVPHLSLSRISNERSRRCGAWGFVPELFALEAGGFLPPSTGTQHDSKSSSLCVLGDIQLRLNTWLSLETGKPATTPPVSPPPSPTTAGQPESPRDESLHHTFSTVITRIQQLQRIKAELIAKREESRLEARRREAECQKLKSQAEIETRRALNAVPADIRSAMIVAKAVATLRQADSYNLFLESKHEALRRLRVQVLRTTAAVPNQLAATSSRLSETFAGISRHRQELLQPPIATLVSSVLGDGFRECQQAVIGSARDVLSSLMTLSLPAFHMYVRLSEVLLDSCERQVAIKSSTVWTYAHFLQMMFRAWSQEFQLVFYGCLFNRSPWLIPYPMSDAKKRTEASYDELTVWCKRLSSLFRLRLALCCSMKNSGECWSIAARLLNRTVDALNHPLVIFLLEAVFEIASFQLSEIDASQFLKLVQLCRSHHLSVMMRYCGEPGVWAEWKVPVIKLESKLTSLINARGIVSERPKGYTLKVHESQLDSSI